MAQVRERIARVANSMAPVMILGESGTGKELVARAIHESSDRASGPFVAVNCGAIPDTLIEAEFFGARKGAYTGATTDREGYFAAARSGTLFLDEIGDLPLPMQAKLLRVIQERRVRPLGGVQEEVIDARILCATHKDLAQAVANGKFRQDLYYRLNVIEIRLPPLRERSGDLDDLVASLMQRICTESGQRPVALSPPALQWLHQHPFPGNVRELENLLHRALALCDGTHITQDDLLDPLASHTAPAPLAFTPVPAHPTPDPVVTPPQSTATTATIGPAAPHADRIPGDLQQHLDEQEKAILIQALQETRGNRTAAAAKLGLNLRQIRYRIARLNIQVGDNDTAPPEA
jgi:two-component system response regulator PilR (NtrC family)